jgi:uncharacterized protein YbbK (DUF523 family)
MLLAHHRSLLETLRTPNPADPWRILLSGCLAGWQCGVDGSDYGMGTQVGTWLNSPLIKTFPFCPEQYALGTPRTMPDIHGGDGVDVLAGRARILDENGVDLTSQMIEGARAMFAFAQENKVDLALLTDMSAACGSQVISSGSRLVQERQFQKGVGVATALLLEAGISVVSQRDFHTLALLRSRIDPDFQQQQASLDHHEHPWTIEHLPGKHPRSLPMHTRNNPTITIT